MKISTSLKPPNKMQLWVTQPSACCLFQLSTKFGDFPGGPVITSTAGGHGFDPWPGN